MAAGTHVRMRAGEKGQLFRRAEVEGTPGQKIMLPITQSRASKNHMVRKSPATAPLESKNLERKEDIICAEQMPAPPAGFYQFEVKFHSLCKAVWPEAAAAYRSAGRTISQARRGRGQGAT